MGNIYLTGMMGCGKSTLARRVAQAAGLRALDLDRAIEGDAGMSITRIFAEKGEEYFRELESNVLFDVHRLDGLVVATGGGTILSDRNYELMRHSGIIIFIDRPVEDIVSTVDTSRRPLLKDGPEKARAIMEQRRQRYESTATRIVRNDGTTAQAVRRILAAAGL